MTNGVDTTATQLIRRSVFGVLDALVVVSENAGSVVDGITSGNSAVNSAAVASPIVTAVPTNAHPSRPRRIASSALTSATAASTARTTNQPMCSASRRRSHVHTRNTTAATAATS